MTQTTETTETETVGYDVQHGVATLTLNRPHRHNAVTPAMQERYLTQLDRAQRDPDVRAVVVTGAGASFSPGADMEVLAGVDAQTAAAFRDGTRASSYPPDFPMRTAKPLIAAVNGACAGVGLVLALQCDLRFAAAGAKLSTSFARRGLVAEYGSAWLLTRLVGTAHALDLLLSARTVTAEEAHALGLVQRVLPAGEVLAAAQAYAGELATWSSPASMAVIKRQVWGDLDRGLAESTAEAMTLMAASFERPDLAEGVASWLERREPRFPPYQA